MVSLDEERITAIVDDIDAMGGNVCFSFRSLLVLPNKKLRINDILFLSANCCSWTHPTCRSVLLRSCVVR